MTVKSRKSMEKGCVPCEENVDKKVAAATRNDGSSGWRKQESNLRWYAFSIHVDSKGSLNKN
jgi:hypothetical protein